MKTVLFVTIAFIAGIVAGAVIFRESPSFDLQGAPPPVEPERQSPEKPRLASGDRLDQESAGDPADQPRSKSTPPPELTFNSSSEKFLKAIRAEFERLGGENFPEEVTPALLEEAEAYLGQIPSWTGGSLVAWSKVRKSAGVMGNPPDLLLQVRGSGRISLNEPASAWHQNQFQMGKPVDVTTPWRYGDPQFIFRRGGVIPFGRTLVVERVDLSGNLGHPQPAGKKGARNTPLPGSLSIRMGQTDVYEAKGIRLINGSILGPLLIDYRSRIIEFQLSCGAVEAKIVGRIVDKAEAATIRPGPVRWVPAGSDGYLKTGRVLLQVLADHGGGNPRTVRLDGSTYRMDSTLSENLWDNELDLEKNRSSFAFLEGAGMVPPGKIFRITRIDYRARLSKPNSSHSDFLLEVKGKKVVRIKADEDDHPSGSWFGPVDLRPGEESQVAITCSYYGMGEAVIWGTLLDDEKEEAQPEEPR